MSISRCNNYHCCHSINHDFIFIQQSWLHKIDLLRYNLGTLTNRFGDSNPFELIAGRRRAFYYAKKNPVWQDEAHVLTMIIEILLQPD